MPRNRRNRPRSRPAVEPLEGRALLAALMVTNTLDSGAGSLRRAITDADAATGPSTIGFDIPGSGVRTISPVDGLPNVFADVTIDGTTQPGYAGTPLIALDGAAGGVGDGLAFGPGSSGSTVMGLAFDRFLFSGIADQGPRLKIQSNTFGIDPTGKAGAGDNIGIEVTDQTDAAADSGTIIDDNVIGNCDSGINLEPAVDVTITGNLIGTDATGSPDLGNQIGIGASPTSTGTINANTIANNAIVGITEGVAGLMESDNFLNNNGASEPSLSLVASDAAIAAGVGQATMTSYTVTNTGTFDATNVQIALDARNEYHLPAGQDQFYQQLSLTGTVTQGMIAVEGTGPAEFVEAVFGTLAPGQSATVHVSVGIVQAGGDFIDANLSADNLPVSSLTAASTAVTGIGQGDRVVTASAPTPPARVGQPETFTFIVADASGLDNPLDTLFALRFTSTGGTPVTGVTTSGGSVAALPAYLNGYGGDLGQILRGQVAIVTATIIPPATGSVTATLFAYSPYQVDPTPANNLAFAASTVVPASSPSVLGAAFLPTSRAIPAVAVDFDNPLNASQAKNVRNYSLATTGADGRIAIGSASYNPTTHVVTLRLSRPLSRPAAAVLVVAGPGSPGLTGAGGSKLLNAGRAFSLFTA